MFASACDLVVCGAGPAGLVIAAASAALGMRVVCIAPAPLEPWARSFAVWAGELPAFGEHAAVEQVFAKPVVTLDEAESVVLREPYVRLNVRALQRSLSAAVERAGVAVCAGTVAGVTHDATGSTVSLTNGEVVRARLVVDASGAGSPLSPRSPRAPAHQIAYGEIIETAPVEMTLMDYRGPAAGAPSFLYALPLAGGRAFLEETVLVTRERIGFADLRARLHARLARMGVARGRVLEEERCVIPLGAPLPVPGARVVAFGAAAGMVHPATGYQLARVMAVAPRVAAALAGPGSPALVAGRAGAACWPAEQRRAWSLFTFGMEALASFDLAATRAFMRAFFRLPQAMSLAFLRGELPPSRVAFAMLRVLLHAAPDVRRRLARLLLEHHSFITSPSEEIA